ncbi:MAG: DNA mismatch repair endonuclease MutL [Gammaproteobacteria bacterium]|nr:DNA mismatch repair endonuclease MutL [Gammaproteobacteria bacterium]
MESTIVPRIQRLPPLLADQIAAGEVVERPASVVKELAENALDAGATRMIIEIRRGGLELIRVTDDGHGIHPDDLRLALDRHATSKIRTAEDLAAIRSLGFRGEALPSVAAVARLRLVSRIADEDAGRELQSIPGDAQPQIRPAAHPVGTTVEVSALFHAVPARRRFLRAEQTEYLHVLDTVRRLALSRPSLALRFLRDGRRVLNVRADLEPRQRLQHVLGLRLEAGARELEYTAPDMRLAGWLSEPAFHRSQSDFQFLFLNGRIVRDRQLSHAVRVAYGDAVPPGRFPAYALHLQLDPAAADVNVHPTKHEVRFRRARDVHDFVSSCVRDALGAMSRGSAVAEPPAPWPQSATPGSRWFSMPGNPPMSAPSLIQDPAAAQAGRLLIAGRYLVTQRDGALWLVDGLALCREIFHRRLMGELRAAGVRRRPLLVPLQVPVAEGDVERIESRAVMIAASGFVLHCSAPAEITIREYPVALSACPLLPVVRGLVPAWTDKHMATAETLIGQLCAELPGSTPADIGIAGLTQMLGEYSDWGTASLPRLDRLLGPEDLARLLSEAPSHA